MTLHITTSSEAQIDGNTPTLPLGNVAQILLCLFSKANHMPTPEVIVVEECPCYEDRHCKYRTQEKHRYVEYICVHIFISKSFVEIFPKTFKSMKSCIILHELLPNIPHYSRFLKDLLSYMIAKKSYFRENHYIPIESYVYTL